MTQQTVTKVRSEAHKCGVCGAVATYKIDGAFFQCVACFESPERREAIIAEKNAKLEEAKKAYRKRAVEYKREQFVTSIERNVIARLDTLKRDINEHIARLDAEDGWPRTASEVVRDIQHDVLWGLANMSLEHLITDAVEYETAKRIAAQDEEQN